MSFSSKTKNELSRKTADDKCCQMAELSGIIHVSGSIQLAGNRKFNVKITTENPAVARLVFTLFKKSLGIHTEVMAKKHKVLKKGYTYYILLQDAGEILRKLEILSDVNELLGINQSVPQQLLKNECCRRAYLRGVFLGGGSISDPEKTYHLEIVTHDNDYGESLKGLINSYDLNSKVIQRKNNYVVYLKEGDQIVDMLNIIGAHTTLLNLENVRIVKHMRNKVNRLVNCETANLNKTVEAAIRQIETIEYLLATVGLGFLPDNLIEVAELRLEHTESSLSELGEMLDPPVGKSGVNHRLRKIEKIAEKLKAEKGEQYDQE